MLCLPPSLIIEKLWNMSFRWKSIESIMPSSLNVEACLGITRNFIEIFVVFFFFLLCYATNVDCLLHHGSPLYTSLHIYAGYAFVHFEDEQDAEDAIRKLDKYPFGYQKRRLIVKWGKKVDGKANLPTKTLFVSNFDPFRTKQHDIRHHFEPYGKVINVRIRRNFSFVHFAFQEDATKALEATQRSKILGRAVTVEYAKDDDERDDAGSPRRSLYDGKANLPTKTLFVGQLDPFRTKEDDIKKHFEPYGKVINVRIRSNYSFVKFATQEDATKALEATQRSKILDRVVSIEYALKDYDERDERDDGGSPRRSRYDGKANLPTKTLFVGQLDPIRTKEDDIKKHFEPYGKVINVRIRSNYSFVHFATQEDATKALEATQRSKILDRVVSIEYALKDDDERDDGGSPRRSLSPVYRKRPSPGACRGNPVYDSYKGPADSERRRSPSRYERSKSPPPYERSKSPPPYERRKRTAPYERRRSLSPYERRKSPTYGRYRSSPRRSLRPVYRTRPSPDYGCRGSPVYDSYKGPAGYERRRSSSPCERRKIPAPNERRRSLSPYERRKSPKYGRYRSRSPVPRGRS